MDFLRCPRCGAAVKIYRNPIPTVDIIIEYSGGIVLIKRQNEPRAWALPGGYCDYGESLEEAAVREAREETGLEVRLIEQFHTYSDPHRDLRQHNISTVFIAQAEKGDLRADDDAQNVGIFREGDIPSPLAHDLILQDYFRYKKTGQKKPL